MQKSSMAMTKELEIDPEPQILLTIEQEIEKIARYYDIPKILEDLGHDSSQFNIEGFYDLKTWTFKELLERKFWSLNRINRWGRVPALITWELRFERLTLYAKKEYLVKKLIENQSFYKDSIDLNDWTPVSDEGKINIHLRYNLSDKRFY